MGYSSCHLSVYQLDIWSINCDLRMLVCSNDFHTLIRNRQNDTDLCRSSTDTIRKKSLPMSTTVMFNNHILHSFPVCLLLESDRPFSRVRVRYFLGGGRCPPRGEADASITKVTTWFSYTWMTCNNHISFCCALDRLHEFIYHGVASHLIQFAFTASAIACL